MKYSLYKLKELYFCSFFYQLVKAFMNDFIPYICNSFADSFIMKLWNFFNKKILNSKPARLLFDTSYLTEIWSKSLFYKKVAEATKKFSLLIPRSSAVYSVTYLGVFLCVVLLLPDKGWADTFWISLFAALTLFYISSNIGSKKGMAFIFVNSLLLIFLVLMELILPYNTVISIAHILLGIDMFFLVSFSVTDRERLGKILSILFVSGAVLCCAGFVQNSLFSIPASAVFGDRVIFGEILVLIFPFCFVYPMEFCTGKRKWFYISIIFILFMNTIAATNSKAAYVEFLVETAIFILLDIKYIPFLILMLPFGLNTIAENIRKTWEMTTSYGNVVNNVVNLFMKIWMYGFGVNRNKFLDFYNAAYNVSTSQNPMLQIPSVKISPIYINVIIDLGAVLMFIFLAYVLRLAHSALTSVFSADKKYRRFFSAGLAMLVGISVSSFFETNLFYSRTLLIYWSMLGILRSVRIMSLDKRNIM